MHNHRPSDQELINDIIRRYGTTIDLKKSPSLILEIIRNFAPDAAEIPDAGVSVAGAPTPPPPPPPPGPTSEKIGHVGNVVDNAEIMREVLKISRQLHALTEEVARKGLR